MNFKDDYNGCKNGKDKNRIVYKKGIFLKSFMGVRGGGGEAVDFNFTTTCVTEPLVGWGKGPGYEVVIKGRRHLSRDQMFLEVCRITARGCPGYEDH